MSKRLEAVVEISSLEDFTAWEVARNENFVSFIRLSKDTTYLETGAVIAEIAAYGSRDINKNPNELIDDLINDECLIVGGGLGIVDGEEEIFPGCCCGLESWDEWLQITPEKHGLWLGHDPDPFVEFEPANQVYRIWSDGGADGNTENSFRIDFSPDELKIALENVDQDLQNFTLVLKNWAQEIAPNQADKLVETFKTHFHIE